MDSRKLSAIDSIGFPFAVRFDSNCQAGGAALKNESCSDCLVFSCTDAASISVYYGVGCRMESCCNWARVHMVVGKGPFLVRVSYTSRARNRSGERRPGEGSGPRGADVQGYHV